MFTPIKINGSYYDFTSLRLSGLPDNFDSTFFTAHLMGVNYSDEVTVTESGGVHGIPLPPGRGTYKATTSMDMVWQAYDAFTRRLKESGLDGYTDLNFDLVLSYKAAGQTCEVKWMESRFLGLDASHQRGSSLTAKIKIYTRYILTNGICIYPLDLDQDLTSVNNNQVVGI